MESGLGAVNNIFLGVPDSSPANDSSSDSWPYRVGCFRYSNTSNFRSCSLLGSMVETPEELLLGPGRATPLGLFSLKYCLFQTKVIEEALLILPPNLAQAGSMLNRFWFGVEGLARAFTHGVYDGWTETRGCGTLWCLRVRFLTCLALTPYYRRAILPVASLLAKFPFAPQHHSHAT